MAKKKKETAKRSKKETAMAKQPKKETAEANDARAAVEPVEHKTKIRITGPVSWLGYSFNRGQEVAIDPAKAKELVESGYAEKI